MHISDNKTSQKQKPCHFFIISKVPIIASISNMESGLIPCVEKYSFIAIRLEFSELGKIILKSVFLSSFGDNGDKCLNFHVLELTRRLMS